MAPGAALLGAVLGMMPPAVLALTDDDDDTAYEQAQASIRMEDWPEAIERLEDLHRESPAHAGALLDLAILYCRIGDGKKADAALDRLETGFPLPPAIRTLVEELRLRSCALPNGNLRWRTSTALGYDTNINQGSSLRSFTLGGGSIPPLDVTLDDAFLPQSSPFVSVHGEISRNTETQGRSYGVFQARSYSATSAFDEMAILAGHERALSGPAWGIFGALNAGMRALGGHLYQQTAMAELRTAPSGAAFGPVSFGLNLREVHARYPSRSMFDSRETAVVVPALWQASERSALRVSLGWLRDAAKNNRPGGNRAGPTAAVEWLHRPGHDTQLYVAWDTRRLSGESPYSPPLLEMTQRQRRQMFTLAWEKRLSRNDSLRLEYQYTRNIDTIPMYRFDNNSAILYWVRDGQF
jgi:hypothetical protein